MNIRALTLSDNISPLLKRAPTIWQIFLAVFLVFYFLPSIIIILNLENNYLLPEIIHNLIINGYDISNQVLLNFHLASYIFLFGYLLAGLYYWLILTDTNFLTLKKSKERNLENIVDLSLSRKIPEMSLIYYLLNFAAILGSIIVILYFLFIGINFLFLLGSDSSMEEFRFFLYSDKYIYYNLILEIARRILLPISVAFFMFTSLMKYRRLRIKEIILWLILFTSGVMTLDRGPIFLSLALLVIYFLIKSRTLTSFLFRSLFWLFIIMIVGGAATYLQYNLGSDITGLSTLIKQGSVVLVNRLFFDPAIMSLTFSFNEITNNNDFLYLSFSRISVLWGNAYTGSLSEGSIFVAPVSVVGDIWRNFGLFGIFLVSFLLSLILLVISKLQNNSHAYMRMPLMFLSVIFSFYIIVGNLFSIGPILILFLIYFLGFMSQINYFYSSDSSKN